MHGAHAFLAALATVLGVAAVTTVLFQRLRQPVVLGYLLAGLIVGPHVPIPLVADAEIVETLSELGVILLMFSLGLEFRLRKLVRLAPTAGVTALIQCSLMVWLGFLTGRLFGWTPIESLFAGAAIAISSTTIIAKAFDEQKIRGQLREIVVGILIVEDLIAILLMAVLTAIARGSGLSAGLARGDRGQAGGVPGRLAGRRDAGRAARDARRRPARPARDHRGRRAWRSASASRCWRRPSATRWRSARSSPARWWPSRARRRRSSTWSSRCATSSRRSSSSRSAC